MPRSTTPQPRTAGTQVQLADSVLALFILTTLDKEPGDIFNALLENDLVLSNINKRNNLSELISNFLPLTDAQRYLAKLEEVNTLAENWLEENEETHLESHFSYADSGTGYEWVSDTTYSNTYLNIYSLTRKLNHLEYAF